MIQILYFVATLVRSFTTSLGSSTMPVSIPTESTALLGDACAYPHDRRWWWRQMIRREQRGRGSSPRIFREDPHAKGEECTEKVRHLRSANSFCSTRAIDRAARSWRVFEPRSGSALSVTPSTPRQERIGGYEAPTPWQSRRHTSSRYRARRRCQRSAPPWRRSARYVARSLSAEKPTWSVMICGKNCQRGWRTADAAIVEGIQFRVKLWGLIAPRSSNTYFRANLWFSSSFDIVFQHRVLYSVLRGFTRCLELSSLILFLHASLEMQEVRKWCVALVTRWFIDF